MSAGALHSLALDDAGELWIWGGNLVGQLGMAPAGLFEWRAKPVRVGNLPRIRAIAAAGSRSAVRTEDGRIFVWGAGVLKPTLAIPAQAGGGLGGNDPGNWTWPVGANWRALASKLGKSPDSIDPKVAILAGRLTRSAKPVAGASVQAAGHFCAETGQDGRFLCVLPASRETILAAYEGGKQIATRTLASLPGARVTEVDLPLQIEPLTLSSHGEPDTRGVRMDVPVHAESPPAAKPGAATKPTLEKRTEAKNPVQTKLGEATTLLSTSPPTLALPAVPATALPSPALAANSRSTTATTWRPVQQHVKGVQTTLQISGTVSLAGYEEIFRRKLANVILSTEGGQCSSSEIGGHFRCSVPSGWSGRIVAHKLNYLFSPSSLAFRSLQEDQPHQDFEATYDP